jgi:hypothetical protein
MDVFVFKCKKKFSFAVESLLTYCSWANYRTQDFLFLAALPTQTEKKSPKSPDFCKTIPRTVLAENPLNFPLETKNSPKSVKFPQNIDALSKSNF